MDDMEDDDIEFEEEEVNLPSGGEVLDREETAKLQAKVIDHAVGLLFVTVGEASGMLRYFKWSPQLLSDEWFNNEDRVRRNTGYLRSDEKVAEPPLGITCAICLEESSMEFSCALCCEHWFCNGCWKGYLVSAVKDGPQCICVRCPQLKCSAAVPDDMVLSFLPLDLRAKFTNFVLRSFVESCLDLKWCPARGCEYAVRAPREKLEVTCKCLASFCWGCVGELHPSVSCELATKWKAKNVSENEDQAWLQGWTKPCPKCKRPISKDVGCSRIECFCCKHTFCWSCLEDWDVHGYGRRCKYAPGQEPGASDRRKERIASKRHEYFFKRFDEQDCSVKKAQDVLTNLSSSLDKLSETHNIGRNELDYIADAWKEIVKGRRALKWSFVYNYYLCFDEGKESKVPLLKHIQDEAAAALDRLQACVLDRSAMVEDFLADRYKLVTLTTRTKQFLESLADSLEDQLYQVDVSASKENITRTKQTKQKAKVSFLTGKTRRAYGYWQPNDEEDALFAGDGWRCELCQFLNIMEVEFCEVCGGEPERQK